MKTKKITTISQLLRHSGLVKQQTGYKQEKKSCKDRDNQPASEQAQFGTAAPHLISTTTGNEKENINQLVFISGTVAIRAEQW